MDYEQKVQDSMIARENKELKDDFFFNWQRLAVYRPNL